MKPNVVVILVDDMGFSDIGAYGSEISTPALDRLAAGGMRLKQFYNVTRCCPTRACLLTGLYPHQAGVGFMAAQHEHDYNSKVNELLDGPGYQDVLNDKCVTIAEAIKPAGYKTLMSGKWHVGYKRPHWPCDRGFDVSFVLPQGGMNYFGHDYHMVKDGEEPVPTLLANDDKVWVAPKEGFYATDVFADRAIEFIEREAKGDKPFFLYLAFNAPHFPLQAKPEDIAKYEGKYAMGWEKLCEERHKRQVALGVVEKKWGMTPPDPDAKPWDSLTEEEKKQWSHRMAVYAAQVDCLDKNIGRVMEAIKKAGIEENTLVMFMSDNGATAETIHRGLKGSVIGTKESWSSYFIGWAHASDTPFRLYKHWVHEGGISSPFIAYWPGTIKAGTMSNQVGHVMDILPTVLEVGGGTYPKEFKGRAITPVEGKSLLPIFMGKEEAVHEEMLFWEHEGNKGVREGDWKAVMKYSEPWELFNMAEDRTEQHDVAGEHPEMVKRFAAAWQEWADRVGVEPWERALPMVPHKKVRG